MELKPEVRKIIDTWYKDFDFEILHFWEKDDIWFVILKSSNPANKKSEVLNFIRVHSSYVIKGEYHVTLDKKIEL